MSGLPDRLHDTANGEQHARPRRGLISLFGRRRVEHGRLRSSIAALVQEAAEAPDNPDEAPELDRQERALIANVLRLRDTTADDVMVPRADIVAMPAAIGFEDALALLRRENHSRLPVYGEQLDDVLGMIHIKDLLAFSGDPETFRVQAILRQPLMIAPQMPVLDLLLQMRQRRIHLALVIDEYGGVDGLVTIEDLVETIVGDISDEHDEPASVNLVERADGTYDVDARMEIEEFEARLGPVLTEDERQSDIETVGGLVFMLAGHVPARGEILTHESGIEFRVLDADARHIRKVRVKMPDLNVAAATETPASLPAAVPPEEPGSLETPEVALGQ